MGYVSFGNVINFHFKSHEFVASKPHKYHARWCINSEEIHGKSVGGFHGRPIGGLT